MSMSPRTTPSTALGKLPNLSDYLCRMTDFSFLGTFNMGYEGFSKPLALNRMNPIWGNKNEFLFLFGVIALVPLVKSARKKNEDALREQVKTTNRWAVVDLTHKQRQPSQWTA